jgi:hypothetical protein
MLIAEAIVKKRKQRKAKLITSQRRDTRTRLLERIALFTGMSNGLSNGLSSGLGLPAWPSLRQMRDRLPGSRAVQSDPYRFEQSL